MIPKERNVKIFLRRYQVTIAALTGLLEISLAIPTGKG